jgi:hypothetical protein
MNVIPVIKQYSITISYGYLESIIQPNNHHNPIHKSIINNTDSAVITAYIQQKPPCIFRASEILTVSLWTAKFVA